MSDIVFRQQVKSLEPSVIAYLRQWIRNCSELPAPPFAGASSPSAEQALLMLSATYGAGVRVGELAGMRTDALLTDAGAPRDRVHIRPETTTHRVSRRVPMHPDIRRDALAFRNRHPFERFIAFVPSAEGSVRPEPMTPNGLSCWFRMLFRAAGLPGLTAQSGRTTFTANQRGN